MKQQNYSIQFSYNSPSEVVGQLWWLSSVYNSINFCQQDYSAICTILKPQDYCN